MIDRKKVVTIYDSPFVKLYDLQYKEGAHYYDASRRPIDRLAAVQDKESLKAQTPDGMSAIVILKVKGQEPRLVLTREYRFPAGQFLLSVPAGLVDPEDCDMEAENPIQKAAFAAAVREIKEEIGEDLEETDTLQLVNPLVFSSPGLTDEANALVKVTLNREIMPAFSNEGAVGGEMFDGCLLVNKEKALDLLRQGVDDEGIAYSVYTWMAMMIFVTDVFGGYEDGRESITEEK